MFNGKRVADLLEYKQWTQSYLAEEMTRRGSTAWSQSLVSAVIRGTKQPSIDSIEVLADVFGVSIDYFYDRGRMVENRLSAIEDNEFVVLLLEYAQKLTPQEQHMMTLLAKRLAETEPTGTPEAQEAANIVDSLSDEERAKALSQLRSVATKPKEPVNTGALGLLVYMAKVIKDETGEDMTAQIENLFNVGLAGIIQKNTTNDFA